MLALTAKAPKVERFALLIKASVVLLILLMATAAPIEAFGPPSESFAAIAKPPARDKILELSRAVTLTSPPAVIVPASPDLTLLVISL